MLIEEIYHKDPLCVSQDMKVVDAVKELLHHKFNALLVVNSSTGSTSSLQASSGQKKLVGVLSLQDIAAATVPEEFRENIFMAHAMYRRGFFAERVKEIKNKPVKEIMRTDFVTVRLDTNIMAVTADFLKNDLYIVPVVENGELKGVVTRSEIKHAIARELGLEQNGNNE